MKALTLVIFACVLGFFSYIFYFKHIWKEPASDFCNYKLPHQYYLVKDSLSGKYAVLFMYIDVFPYYLREVKCYSLFPDWSIMDASVNDATLFADSCAAKRCLDQALRVEKEYRTKRNFKVQ